jgi:Na+/melibiose symporter-like transporter
MSALVAQRRLLTGWLSAIVTLGFTFPAVLGSIAGGQLSAHAKTQGAFLIVAALALVIVLLSLWRPRAIFAAEHEPVPDSETHWKAMVRLAGHRVFWIPLAIQFFWNFAPAWGTPATYYVTNHLKFNDAQFGLFGAVEMVCFVPPVLLYGFVCRRFSMRSLLWIGTIFGILQGPPLLFAHNYSETMAAGVAFGLLGGFGSAAYWDLLLRCCPKGLEGTATMMGWSLFWIASKSSDFLGSWLYDHGGFLQTIVVTTVAYILIVPLLFMIPKAILDSREGEEKGLSRG